ncbi:MAG: NUDIX hydrolase [Lachnospiraceae bacterium]|nr:NUDIX hydrolase [Lachnospiraceae bacterium]
MRECEYLKSPGITQEEIEFLKSYRPDAYPKPSVTTDIVTLTVDEDNDLSILLIKRGGYPYKDKWALPGGFLEVDRESVTEAARRELVEETGVTDALLRQLYTFGEPDRDPRMHVISVAYTALIPKSKLKFQAGDDASDAKLFKIQYDIDGMTFRSGTLTITQAQLAFDHARSIRLAVKRLRNRIDYEPDAFYLLEDRHDFTIYELKKIYESIKHEKLDTANFRKSFLRDYVLTERVRDKNEKREGNGAKPAALYSYTEEIRDEF